MRLKIIRFHLVRLRPWPLVMGFCLLNVMLSVLISFNTRLLNWLLVSTLIILTMIFFWWRDVSRESCSEGEHNPTVNLGLKIGILLFIVSEVIFFVSFFWSFLHRSMVIGYVMIRWPPANIKLFSPMEVPLLNTIILLSSGVSVTWGHHIMINGSWKGFVYLLAATIRLGILFTLLQAVEYFVAPFRISDRVLGRTFFIATGFHGLHVIIGSLFLMVSLIKVWYFNRRVHNSVGFECSAWYWHFVDVVWLFLYVLVYWWGQ